MSVWAGTVIVALQTPLFVYVGVDSKVISIGPQVASAATQPKMHQIDHVLFAHAGIFKDAQSKLDVIATATSAITAGGDMEQIAQQFITNIKPQLESVLPQIKAENPRYFDEKLKQPLAMLFASARDGTPRLVAVTFDVAKGSTDVTVRVLRCPGDCDPRATVNAISLGEHDATDQFLDTYPKNDLSRDPDAAIRGAIEYQARATPDYVALPATVWSVSTSGIHEIR